MALPSVAAISASVECASNGCGSGSSSSSKPITNAHRKKERTPSRKDTTFKWSILNGSGS
uniref:Uncharacterized protein n=1 Tax=Anopheles funestus TaxID=62324 RepID=A0A182R4N9_ANOFN